MPGRDHDRFDSLPNPPPLSTRAITPQNLIVVVSELREAVRHLLLVQRTIVDVSRNTDETASEAARKLHDVEGHLFGSDRFGPGILGDLQASQRNILKLGWTILGFLIVGLISVVVALLTGHVSIPG